VTTQGPEDLAAAWLAAARDEGVALELESIYAYTAAAIEARGPACWASGRCCNFEAVGHRLYTTGLEAAYTVSRLAEQAAAPALTPASLEAALARGGCPFQVANLCGVHTIKPLGCRVYFCDRSAQEWQMDLSERTLGRLKTLHERHGIEYRYGEWRAMLGMFVR
jgi:Fe-S-cluster containining protein